jgi:hypothetical protein
MVMGNIYPQKPPLGSQINQGHPLSQGLVGCWLMNEGGGEYIRNIVTNIPSPFSSDAQTRTQWQRSPKGYVVDANASNPRILPAENQAYWNTPRITVFAICITDATTANQNLLTKWHAGLGRRNFKLGIGPSGSTWCFRTWDGAADVVAESSTNFDTTNYHAICGQNDGQNINLFVDGILTAQTAFVGDIPQTASALRFFVDNQDAGDWNGRLALAYYWKRTLLQSEIQSLTVSPYQVISKPKYRFYSIPSGGTTVSLSSLSLSLSQITPLIKYDFKQSLSALSLALTNYDPSVLAQVNVTVTPSVITLSLNQFDPTVIISGGGDCLVALSAALALSLTQQPLNVNYNFAISLSALSLSLGLNDPTVGITSLAQTYIVYQNSRLELWVGGVEVARFKSDGSIDVHTSVNQNAF